MKIKSWTFVLALLVLFLTSCTTDPKVTQTLHADEKVVARKTGQSESPAPYRLGFGDVIEVKFFKNTEYNEVVPVRPDGKVSLQRIGDVNVIGMTIERLDSLVTTVYSEILVDPDVTIFLREFGGQEIYVMGEVEKPGPYQYTKGMSVLRAIASAGGPKRGAKMNSVILIRGNEAANLLANRIDLTTSNLQALMEHDQPTRPYDIVYVPKSFVQDVNEFMTQMYDVVLPPIDVVSRWTWYQTLLD